MAKWTKNKVNPEQINNGNEYSVNDNVSVEELNGIVNNSLKAQEDAERALELAIGANEANGTVVKINGEPQGTWDATFSQELYEESANEIWLEDVSEITENGITYSIKDGAITIRGTATTGFGLFINAKTPINSGTYYYKAFVNGNKTSSGSWAFANGWDVVKYISINILNQSSLNGFKQLLLWVEKGETFNNYEIKPMLSKFPFIDFYKFNPNRHITNEQAEFLKEEFEKQVNIIPNTAISKTEYGITWTVNEDKSIKISGTSTAKTTIGLHTTPIQIDKGTYNLSISDVATNGVAIGCKIGSSYYSAQTNNPITLTENQIFEKWYIDVESGKTVDITLYPMFVKGYKKQPYSTYNSSSHITNPQADLLKSEWEKQVNIINIEPYNISINNGHWGREKLILEKAKGGQKYCINVKCTTISGQQGLSYSIGRGTSGYQSDLEFNIPFSRSYVFTVPQQYDGENIYLRIPRFSQQTTGEYYLYDFFLCESEEVVEPQPYNGPIIHEKDIAPVLLWSNDNINSTFTPQNANFSMSMSGYKKLIIIYKDRKDDYILPQKMEFDISTNPAGKVCNLFNLVIVSGPVTWQSSREFIIGSDLKFIEFVNAYRNNTVNNDAIIPIKIYVSN